MRYRKGEDPFTIKWRFSLWLIKDAAADVVVRVRRTVVVDVERTVILVLVVVTAMVQARVTTVKVPVIRDIVCCKVDCCLDTPTEGLHQSHPSPVSTVRQQYPPQSPKASLPIRQ